MVHIRVVVSVRLGGEGWQGRVGVRHASLPAGGGGAWGVGGGVVVRHGLKVVRKRVGRPGEWGGGGGGGGGVGYSDHTTGGGSALGRPRVWQGLVEGGNVGARCAAAVSAKRRLRLCLPRRACAHVWRWMSG